MSAPRNHLDRFSEAFLWDRGKEKAAGPTCLAPPNLHRIKVLEDPALRDQTPQERLMTAFLASLRDHEGFVSHMYLDTVAQITIGFGANIDEISYAKFTTNLANTSALHTELFVKVVAFFDEYDTFRAGAPRTDAASIKKAFEYLWKHKTDAFTAAFTGGNRTKEKPLQNHSAASFGKDPDVPRINEAFALVKAKEHASKDITWLVGKFPAFWQWPDEARLALLDMTYNIGQGKFLTSGDSRFPNLFKALTKEGQPDFAAAARECRRNIPGVQNGRKNSADVRNYWTYQLLSNAAVKSQTPSAVSPRRSGP